MASLVARRGVYWREKEFFEDLLNQSFLLDNFLTQVSINFGNNLSKQLNQANSKLLILLSPFFCKHIFFFCISCFTGLCLFSPYFVNDKAQNWLWIKDALLFIRNLVKLLETIVVVDQRVVQIEELNTWEIWNALEVRTQNLDQERKNSVKSWIFADNAESCFEIFPDLFFLWVQNSMHH